jgi:hypothetical protein
VRLWAACSSFTTSTQQSYANVGRAPCRDGRSTTRGELRPAGPRPEEISRSAQLRALRLDGDLPIDGCAILEAENEDYTLCIKTDAQTSTWVAATCTLLAIAWREVPGRAMPVAGIAGIAQASVLLQQRIILSCLREFARPCQLSIALSKVNHNSIVNMYCQVFSCLLS